MDSFKNMFDSFREFIWDILGYFIPGAFLISMLSFFLTEEHKIESNLLLLSSEYSSYFFVLVSYVLGYVIFGVGEYLKEIQQKTSFHTKIEDKVRESKNVLLSIKKLTKITQGDGVEENFDEYNLRCKLPRKQYGLKV